MEVWDVLTRDGIKASLEGNNFSATQEEENRRNLISLQSDG